MSENIKKHLKEHIEVMIYWEIIDDDDIDYIYSVVEVQAKQEKAKEIKKDFQPIFEVLGIDKSPEIIKIWRKHLGDNENEYKTLE